MAKCSRQEQCHSKAYEDLRPTPRNLMEIRAGSLVEVLFMDITRKNGWVNAEEAVAFNPNLCIMSGIFLGYDRNNVRIASLQDPCVTFCTHSFHRNSGDQFGGNVAIPRGCIKLIRLHLSIPLSYSLVGGELSDRLKKELLEKQ